MVRIDTEDLVDSAEVADIIGLAGGAKAVSVYRSRYRDFPEPVLVKAGGRLHLWRRQDVELWAAARTRR